MLSSLVKYKDLALKVIYYTKRRQLGSKIFFATSKFQEVLLYFEKNLKDPQTFLKSSYFLNGKQIFPNDILLYFCTVDPNLRLVEEDLFIEIEELEHIDDSSEPIFSKLLKPLINPFKLIMLNVKEGILQMVDFDKDKIKNFGFDCLVNNNYACCNSLDALYISFGKNLWIISNKNFALEKKEMPIAKEKHSMVYIVSNNTIFIAGGDNTDSFYYDINNKEFIPWGKMSGIQEKPALIQYGDFLYSFNSFNPSGIYFERTKLTSPAKKWEKLIPQSGDQESGFFYNKLFGVSKCSGGNILFAGGINNQLRTFVYNLKLNVLYININKDESILLSERTFYKIDHNFNIGITQNIEKNHIIAIINKNSKSLYLLPFEQIGNKTRNNLLQYDNPRNRLPGNLVIQCRYMSIKDYENFLKQKEAQKKGKLNAPNNKNEIKKIGEKDVNEPFKFQYRNKTPLALERISEGKSDEENDDDEYRNKSSSAKKEKRKLELGVDSIEKFNLMMKKKENDKNKEKEKSEEKNNNNEKDKNCHSDLEPEERFNQDNTNTEAKQKINITDNNNNEQNKEKDETKKKLGLSDNNQISKSHKIIGNIKEEKVINKSKQSSKRSINSANNNTNDNKANKKDSTIKKSLNININTNNNNMKKIDINDKKENTKEIKENSNKINNNQKINNQQNISARTTTNNNFNNKDNVNNTNQQNNKIVNINSKTSNTTEQKKIVNIEKYNNNNTQVHIINQNKKSSSSNIASSNANQQKNQQNNSNPFVDTNKYNNISEKESTHLKNKSEQLLKKVDNSKTMNMTQQKKHNILKPPSTNTEDSRIQTDPNVSNNTQANNIKISSYKSSTHRQSQNEQKNIMYNNNTDNTNSNSQKLKKTNSFQVRININQDPKGRQETQKVKINTNANKTQSGNTNNNYNNTNVVISNNNGIRITKSTNQQNINVSNNNEANKDGKRYVLTKNVQRIRKDNDGQKKV